jgi:hypothetical protein
LPPFTAVFSVSQDDSYWALLVQQLAGRGPDVTKTDQPGLVVVQIDGLPHDVITRQVRAGRVPHISSWLRSGKYHLSMWDALLPPTTPARPGSSTGTTTDPRLPVVREGHGKIMVTNRG